MDERWQKGEFWLYAPYVLAHELCHYLAARLLGIPATLHWRQAYTWLDSHAAPPRLMLAILAPALAGMGSLLAWAWASMLWRSPFLFLLTLGFHLGWWLMCLNNFYLVWFYRRHGRWPARQNADQVADDDPGQAEETKIVEHKTCPENNRGERRGPA